MRRLFFLLLVVPIFCCGCSRGMLAQEPNDPNPPHLSKYLGGAR